MSAQHQENIQQTVLFNAHKRLGAKMVPFAGWEMPVQYAGVIPEHLATRTAAGLFDVSHMGEIWVSGPSALKLIDSLTCNRVTAIQDGRAQYNAIINPNGGIVDDIIVYRFNPERFLICVNASNAEKDFAWLSNHNSVNAELINASKEYGQIALQGPRALEILAKVTNKIPERSFSFTEDKIEGSSVIIARTGYTGEDGVEIFTQAAATEALWERLLEVGKSSGLVPCGLGARDSLRLEACLPLHGHELGDDISAYESGLGWIIKLDKGEFLGKQQLEKHSNVSPRKLVGFFIADNSGIARHADPVFSSDGVRIGAVTSGTKTPTLGRALGLALVDARYSTVGTELGIEVRGRKLAAQVVNTPFYRRAK